MKLIHRDFRPLRRSKYVAQPLKRRPTLRILLLAALGVTVYLKYDTVVQSKAFKRLSEPGRLWHAMRHGEGAPPVGFGAGLNWSPDSSFLEAECSGPAAAACLESWSSLGREPVGTLRAVMEKARIQWDADAENGFSAKFARLPEAGEPLDGTSPDLELIRVELRSARSTLTLEHPSGHRPGAFCAVSAGNKGGKTDRDGLCLDDRRTQLPFSRSRIGIPSAGVDSGGSAGSAVEAMAGEEDRVMRIFSLEGPVVRPVLAGRVVAVPGTLASEQTAQWVKIYHGENTFSCYRGFSSLRPGMKPGDMIGMGDTLGFVAMQGVTTEALEVRIERDGIPADPFGFLGIARAENGL